ncbi:N-acetylglucosamine-6-phosphate deacetylase [Zavarzinella formosa]|uniref:N-acetylglucosamine-6-phosphate deacetylase n=1 Tax=Zavarzinella formosa TaxID=360055 RepID=UPI00031CBDF2|nr:N-acetylglucosamine-6-phosphate deacetylase [Zavarzinella formosa]
MSKTLIFTNGTIITPDATVVGDVVVTGEKIRAVGRDLTIPIGSEMIDLENGYLLPGFVDLHLHGAGGADFMDGTTEAFRTVLECHARHGTTSCTPTTTVASHARHMAFFEQVKKFQDADPVGSRVLGAHLYGPYFAKEARGCHPAADVRPPTFEDYAPYLEMSKYLRTATVAPELPGAAEFVKACRQKGVRCNAGHSHATFEQVEEAIGWGIQHVDHLFCAMSDRARLRQTQTYPMRAGLMEATLYFEELTTEIIADGKHLNPALMKLAYKIKGPNRLAIVSDAMRGMDMPDGQYVFGPPDSEAIVWKKDGVGITPDGKALASSVTAIDHGLRTFVATTPVPLVSAVRMVSLTPARIAGVEDKVGSIEPGKYADLVWTDKNLEIRGVWIGGRAVSR